MDFDIKNAPEQMYKICRDIFPYNRSLSGQGVRDTLEYIKNILPELEIKSIKSGEHVFDWIVPEEWNVRDAYVMSENGEKVIDIKNSNLHLVGYSEPIDKVVTFAELDERLFSIPEIPEAIPYVTSYYKRTWGFCLRHSVREKLRNDPNKKYRVVIDSTLDPNGVLNYADITIPGNLEGGRGFKEILFTSYVCHPSMANNELSGIAVAVEAAKYIKSLPKRKYDYRLVFAPETLGALIYLRENLENFKKNLAAGFVLTCIGDSGDYSCLQSPYGDTLADKTARHMLKYITEEPNIYSFLDRGSDERQYCSPGAGLPLCTLMRTKWSKYKFYHTSFDDLNFISPEGLGGGFMMVKNCIDLLELNETYRVTTVGEPQLGRRGLYPEISTSESGLTVRNLMNLIAYADGKNDLIDIAEIIGVDALSMKDNVDKMVANGLFEKVCPPSR